MTRRIRAIPKAAIILTGCIIMASAVYAVTLQRWPISSGQKAFSEQALAPVAPRTPLETIVTRPVMVTWGDLELAEQDSPMGDTSAMYPTYPGHPHHPQYPGHPEHHDHLGDLDQARAARVGASRLQIPVLAGGHASGVMARFSAPPRSPVATRRSRLPAVPTRDDVYGVMGSIRNAVQHCYDTGMVPGEVNLTLTVAGPTGLVKRASVSETSSTATCILKLARTLRFPRFARNSVTIQYPYLFK